MSLNGTTLAQYQYDNAFTTANVTGMKQWDSTQSAWITNSQSYASQGNVATEGDARGIITAYCYDAQNLYPTVRVVAASSTNCPSPAEMPEGLTTAFNFADSSGMLQSVTDSDNHITTTYSYDNLGRQTAATQTGGALSRTTSTTYDDVGLTSTTTQDDLTNPVQQLVSTTAYDPVGRVRLTTDGAGNKVSQAYRYGTGFRYQLQSTPYASGGPTGWTLTTMDTLGRVTEVDHYSGSAAPGPWGSNTNKTGTSTAAYDQSLSFCAGPASTTTDEAGNTHANCTDGLGQLISVAEPDPASGSTSTRTVTSYSYDMLSNLVTVDVAGQANTNCTLPGSQTMHMRCFVYSTLSRLISASNPESGTAGYTYDAAGNLTQIQDANLNVTTIGA